MTTARPPLSYQLQSMPFERKTIVLADPRWAGHHPTYFAEFAASLLRQGHRVLALCPEPEEFRETAVGICERLALDPKETLWVGKLNDPNRAYLRPGHDHDPISTVLRWRFLRKAIDVVQAASGWQAEFVFLPWLDSYLRFQVTSRLPELVLRLPWSGLYFRNHHFSEPRSLWVSRAKGDCTLRSPLCRHFGVLDERFVEAMEAESGKKAIVFPDITNEADAAELSPFAQEILAKADGRKVVGMVSLEKRKGFLTMLRIAERVADREDWFFVAAGMYGKSTCSEEEQAYVEDLAARVASGEISNIHLELPGGRINDGVEFNSLIKAFDVIYAAYEDFQGSSNALTKGAIFRRPLVATRGECVGGRVEKFGLGVTFDQGDVDQGEEAIRRTLVGVDWSDQPLALRYADYHEQHNRRRLDAVMAEIVG